jgi:hypothetical protein
VSSQNGPGWYLVDNWVSTRNRKVAGSNPTSGSTNQQLTAHIALPAPRSPTTTGKVERFHKTLRAELLDGLRFDSLAQAQQVIDLWVSDYNTRRPHQALAMATPAERFTAATSPPLPAEPPLVVAQEPVDTTPRRPRSGGPGEMVGWCMPTASSWSPARSARSVVATPAKPVVVQVEPNLLHVFCDGVYLKTIPRTTTGEVTQVRAHRRNNHRPVR